MEHITQTSQSSIQVPSVPSKKTHQWSVSKYQGGKVPLASARIFAAHWHTPQIKVPQALAYVKGTLPLIQVQRHLRCCTVQSWNGSILTSAETRSRGAAPPEKLGRCTGDTEGLPHATSALGPQNDSLPTLCCWAPECFFPQCRAVWGPRIYATRAQPTYMCFAPQAKK